MLTVVVSQGVPLDHSLLRNRPMGAVDGSRVYTLGLSLGHPPVDFPKYVNLTRFIGSILHGHCSDLIKSVLYTQYEGST